MINMHPQQGINPLPSHQGDNTPGVKISLGILHQPIGDLWPLSWGSALVGFPPVLGSTQLSAAELQL